MNTFSSEASLIREYFTYLNSTQSEPNNSKEKRCLKWNNSTIFNIICNGYNSLFRQRRTKLFESLKKLFFGQEEVGHIPKRI
jgi:hypothetical protein